MATRDGTRGKRAICLCNEVEAEWASVVRSAFWRTGNARRCNEITLRS